MAAKYLRIAGITAESITDGPGLRMTVFAQGCPHHCPGCHNPQTHDPRQGRDVEIDWLLEEYRTNPLLCGITISGGEPFCQPVPLASLARAVRRLGGNVVVYTGYTLEQLQGRPGKDAVFELLAEADFLVDGPYIQARRTFDLPFRGSSNQRWLERGKDFLA